MDEDVNAFMEDYLIVEQNKFVPLCHIQCTIKGLKCCGISKQQLHTTVPLLFYLLGHVSTQLDDMFTGQLCDGMVKAMLQLWDEHHSQPHIISSCLYLIERKLNFSSMALTERYNDVD